MQLFCVFICIEQAGPRGGRRKPLMSQYVVLADTAEEARAIFTNDMSHIADSISAVMPWGDRIARIA
jgi:hypothetical protein